MKTQSYGCCGRNSSADPTPEELQKRIREVHELRKQEDDERRHSQHQRSAAIQRLLRREGALSRNQIARQLGMTVHFAVQELRALRLTGVIERQGASNLTVYRLVDDNTVCDLPSVESILAHFRAMGERKAPSRKVRVAHNRPTKAA